jgi:hypothetical protein
MLTLTLDLLAAPMPPVFSPHVTPVAPALGRAFNAECFLHDAETDRALHDAIIALVERLKRDSLPPERVVIALKAAIVKYGSVERMPSLVDEAEDLCWAHCAETYRKAFAWCLDAYFGTTPAR